MAAKEIKEEEFPSLEAVNTSDNAKVHAVVSSLSPMKKGKAANFFEATITDGKTEMRVVGFQGTHRKRLADFQENSQTVTLENCKIKKARQSDDLEVQLKSNTTLRKSPMKYAVSSKSLMKEDICLKDLTDKPVYSKVSFQAKVINVDYPAKLAGGLSKQEVTVADSTAAARITLWQSDINTVEEFESYYFKGMSVRSFKNENNLSKPKDDASITPIDDIGDVVSDDLPQNSVTVHNAEVIGVQSLQSYAACLACNGKVNEVDADTNIAQCSKCQMSQPLKRCHKTEQNYHIHACHYY